MIMVQSPVFAVGAQDLGVGCGSSFEVTLLGPESAELHSGQIQLENSIFRLGYALQQCLPCWETASLMLTLQATPLQPPVRWYPIPSNCPTPGSPIHREEPPA